MRRCLVALFALGLGACAHEEARPQQSAQCSIPEVKWTAAETDFNKTLTADTLEKLNQIARADRDSFRVDPSGRSLGDRLGQLNSQMTNNGPFVAHSAAEAATRLRQLECAIQRGTFNGRTADADHLYGNLIVDVDNQLKMAKNQ